MCICGIHQSIPEVEKPAKAESGACILTFIMLYDFVPSIDAKIFVI